MNDNLNQFNNEWLTNSDSKFPGHFGNGRNVGRGVYQIENPDTTQTLTSMTQNTVVIVGGVLLLLNLLCFMGLFYQRERLKKAEVHLRKRYLEVADAQDEEQRGTVSGGGQTTTEMESVVSEPYGIGLQRPSHVPRAPLDTLSETETDNGFGPDFLGPNYDPRTKVSRWMFQQNRDRGDEDPGYPMQTEVIVENREHSPPSYPAATAPAQVPIQIQLTSSQRNSMVGPSHAPMEFLPPLPYQDPFRPSIPISDIPYADSRATSPSVSNFQVQTPPPAFNNNLSNNNFNYNLRRSIPSPTNSSTTSSINLDRKRNKGKIVIPLRNSVIIREMESDDEVESSAPKLVPVKTGTLTRSVAVGSNTNDDTNGIGSESRTVTASVHSRPGHHGHGTGQKVTFADEIL